METFKAWVVVDGDGKVVHRYASSGIYTQQRSAETLAHHKNYPAAKTFRVVPVLVTPVK